VTESFRNLLSWPRRHLRLLSLLLVLAIPGAGAAGVSLWAQYHFDAARHALDRDDLDEALYHLDLCLKVPFRGAAVHLLAAQAARRRDAYEEAEKQLAACEQLAGMTKEVARERLLLTAQQGELEGVEGLLQSQTSANDRETVLILESLAKGYSSRFWQAEALECLNRQLERRPRHSVALLMRAHVFEELARKGQVEYAADALRDYEQAIEVNPSFDARLGLASALYRVGRPRDALLEYERLRSALADNAEVLLGLARCRYSLHELDDAQRLLDELLEQHPDHKAALLERGRLALHTGKLDEAEKWLRRAVVLALPCEAGPLRSLSQCLEAQNKHEEASRCLDRLRKNEMELLGVDCRIFQANRDPHNVALRYEIARDLMRLGREQEGVAALFHVLEQQPRHGPADAMLADYFERIGQPVRAARHRAKASPAGELRPGPTQQFR
jgi:tetratricopeptide (TPR) repeat protein